MASTSSHEQPNQTYTIFMNLMGRVVWLQSYMVCVCVCVCVCGTQSLPLYVQLAHVPIK